MFLIEGSMEVSFDNYPAFENNPLTDEIQDIKDKAFLLTNSNRVSTFYSKKMHLSTAVNYPDHLSCQLYNSFIPLIINELFLV